MNLRLERRRLCPREPSPRNSRIRLSALTLAWRPRIGIPRALTTHSLLPLYSTFFSGLGMEVVLSDVDPRGELKSNSGFCFPAQIAHGALLDLAERGVDLVFLPHVVRMPQANACRDSYLCPVTQAGPYFLAKAFPDLRFLSPLLDFTSGYEASSALVEMAVRDLGTPRPLAEQAWTAAVRAQTEVERALRRDWDSRPWREAVAEGKPAILLAGRSYNAFTPEGSQSVGKKLSSMGVTVIPADCLAPVGEGPTAWHFANQILNAVALCRQHPNLFLLCVSNFSCTIDAFTHAMLASELGSKPYLILEIDAHTADAGVQTRLEAFLDIVANYRTGRKPARTKPFIPCRLVSGGHVIRVKWRHGRRSPTRACESYFPNFSQIHAQALRHGGALAGPAPGRGAAAGPQPARTRPATHLGPRMPSAADLHRPTAAGARTPAARRDRRLFHDARRRALRQRIPTWATLNASSPSNGWPTFSCSIRGRKTTMADSTCRDLARHFSAAIAIADILVEIEHVLRVVGANGSLEQLRRQWEQFATHGPSLDQFHAGLPGFVDRLAALPRTREPLTCPRVVVTGDFFTRFSPFFMEGVAELYAERGIILKPVDLSDLVLYAAYHGVAEAAQCWGMKPGGLALAKACTRVFQPDGKQYLQQVVELSGGAEVRRSITANFFAGPDCSWPGPTRFPRCSRKPPNTSRPPSTAK